MDVNDSEGDGRASLTKKYEFMRSDLVKVLH